MGKKYSWMEIVQDPKKYFKAQQDPQKYFKSFSEYKKFADSRFKPSARNSHTDQQAINRWLLSGGGRQEEKKESSSKKKSGPFDYDEYFGGGGKGGNGGRGGGAERRERLERRERKGLGGAADSKTRGIKDKGLEFYGKWGDMTPAAFDFFKEIKLRKLDGRNANELQNIINAGKIQVAAIQRDASIYGSLVSGFW